MNDELEEIGPIDYVVIEFPNERLSGEAFPLLVDLVDRGLIRIIDLTFVRKELDGSVVAMELADFDQDGLCPELTMNWDEIRHLAADPIVTIGAHTRRHYALAKLTLAEARTEIASHVEKSLATLTSFSEDISSRGMKPGCIWISKEIGRPAPMEMMALGISNNQNVVRLRRIRTADARPIAIENSTVPVRFLPSPDLVAESLYEALAKLDALPSRAVQRMRSRPASETDARLLDCEPGAPLLIMERRCFLASEQIVEFSETRYRGDVYDFVVELHR